MTLKFTAQDARRATWQRRVRSLAAQTLELEPLADRHAVVEQWPSRLDGLISDAKHRSRVLGGIAWALGEDGRTEAALGALRLALAAARSASYESTASAVNDGMAALTAGPRGVTVRQIYEMINDVESWLRVR